MKSFIVVLVCGVIWTGEAMAAVISGSGEEPVVEGNAEERVLRWNARILESIEREMPKGGGYATTPVATEGFRASVKNEREGLEVRPFRGPTFCSAATYTLLLKVVAPVLKEEGERNRLVPGKQGDGEGVWGRWNANGPGVAVLFAETGAGVNFTDWRQARPGDFLKVWWTDAVGHQERGHLVVFLGRDETSLTFWSGNKPEGYGKKTVALAKVKRVLFSRLLEPERLGRGDLVEKNEYLSSMLRRGSAWEEVLVKSRVREGR